MDMPKKPRPPNPNPNPSNTNRHSSTVRAMKSSINQKLVSTGQYLPPVPQQAHCAPGPRNRKIALLSVGVMIACGIIAVVVCTTTSIFSGGPVPSPPLPASPGSEYLGTMCNGLTADGCNPSQLPGQKSAYVPSKQLLSARSTHRSDPIRVMPGSGLDEELVTEMNSQISATSQSTAKSFGVSALVPYSGVMFSGGAAVQDLFQTVFKHSTSSYYAHAYITFSHSELYYDPESQLEGSAALSAAVSSLPTSLTPASNLAAYFDFFSSYGTHYVKRITMGGLMRLSATLDSSSWSTSQGSSASMSAAFGALFSTTINLNATASSSSSQQQADAVDHVASSKSFMVLGGDETQTDVAAWIWSHRPG